MGILIHRDLTDDRLDGEDEFEANHVDNATARDGFELNDVGNVEDRQRPQGD
ncbi:MAG: hypothetical protein PHE55_17065 [Methylococcaceae bacterium]|nr:hypothetical protein [Methylococcaceae bacterium]